jgi:hypothetical protein
MQREALMGYGGGYERAGAAERQASPYIELGAMGQDVQGDTSKPFDLNAPGVVVEIKKALVALAQADADPLRNPDDPIQETVWQHIVLQGPHADAWEGAAADELVTAMSRYAPTTGLQGPFVQLGGSKFGKYGIVGGAQPTAQGLEVLAGAVQQRLGGQPAMTKYLAWRGGAFAPPSTVSGPPANAQVIPSGRHGAFWDPSGYTPLWDGAPDNLKQAVTQLDESLIACIQQQADLKTEGQRLIGINDCLLPTRASRHQAVLLANEGAPPPECPAGHSYDAAQGRCVEDTGIVDLPPPSMADCVKAYMEIEGKSRAEAEAICMGPGASGDTRWARMGGAALVGGAIGLGLYYLTTTRRRRR